MLQQNARAGTRTRSAPAILVPAASALAVLPLLLQTARAAAPYKRDNRRVDVAQLPPHPGR